MKKFLSLLLVFAVAAAMVCAFAVNVSAEEEEVKKPENATWLVDEGDDHVWWELTDNDTGLTLTIGGEGGMPNFQFATDKPWNNDAGNITAVEINSGVTSIGANAFSWCTSLKEVTIPGSVKSIGNNAFDNCSSITTLTIPEGVTSIEFSAFCMCVNITTITIPGTVGIVGDNAFVSCRSITTLTISEGVTSIGAGAFSGCKNIKEVTIPASVTSIGDNAFMGCSNLATVTIPESVKSIGNNAFRSCSRNLVIHGKSGTAAEQSAKENDIDFFDNGKCKHFAHFYCETCRTNLTRSELLKAWGLANLSGSTISGGSLTIVLCVVCLAVGFLVAMFIFKKKKPALASGENTDEE